MRQVLAARGAEFAIVRATLGKAKRSIRPTKNVVSVFVVLTVILPETNGANLIRSTLPNSLETAARATEREFINAFHVRPNRFTLTGAAKRSFDASSERSERG
jgi:hypothetical protein